MFKFTFIDLFAGIGGFRLACEAVGGECLGFSEIAPEAIDFYCLNHKEAQSKNFGNVTKIQKLPKCDLLTAGVPCQSWSIAGKKLGFNDDRGQLWNDTLYLLEESKPKAFIFENVKGLSDSRNKEAIDYIMQRIKDAGYYAEKYVLNAFDYGVPQARVRTYIIGFREKTHYDSFKIPQPDYQQNTLKLGRGISCSDNGLIDYFLFSDLRNGDTTIHSWDLIETTDREKKLCQILMKNRRKRVYGNRDGNPLSLEHFKSLDPTIGENDLEMLVDKGIFEKIDTGYGIKYDFKNRKISTGINGVYRIFLHPSKVFPTLVASDTNDYVVTVDNDMNNLDKRKFINEVFFKGDYRKITKEEACTIQGFPRNFILPEKRSKWMKLIGNSVAVPLVKILVQSIVNTHIFEEI